MPKREQFFQDIAGENRHVALLMAQVGAMPTEIQLLLEVADYLDEKKGLKSVRTYLVRVLGAEEHRIMSFGMTAHTVQLTTDHPLLYEYNAPPCGFFFRGQPTDAHALTLDIAQAHATLFQGWRQFPEYLNVSQPLVTLLKSGGGLLGQMPLPLANALDPVLQAYGLETKIMQGQHANDHDSPIKDQQMTALILGDSYFLSYAYSFEEFVGRK